ncbi:SMI1/KNR4 family protein [Deinococcus oregonensis]|uniref:SMI1/KNR4 family protein n=1 Tax=Deinococcus oregonensis TaxID=1805970 RepID=A0ABV6B083_9DEIO
MELLVDNLRSTAQNIIDRLHESIELEETDYIPVTDDKILAYQTLLQMKLPDWYINFQKEFGQIECLIEQDGRKYWFSTFSIDDSQGHYQDLYDANGEMKQRIPLGTDMGGRAVFYSERDGRNGIYISYSIPDSTYFRFIADTLEDFLFRGIGISVFLSKINPE